VPRFPYTILTSQTVRELEQHARKLLEKLYSKRLEIEPHAALIRLMRPALRYPQPAKRHSVHTVGSCPSGPSSAR